MKQVKNVRRVIRRAGAALSELGAAGSNRKETLRRIKWVLSKSKFRDLEEARRTIHALETHVKSADEFRREHKKLPKVQRLMAVILKRSSMIEELRKLTAVKSFEPPHLAEIESAKYWVQALGLMRWADIRDFRGAAIETHEALIHEFEKAGLKKQDAEAAAERFSIELIRDQTAFHKTMSKIPENQITKYADLKISECERNIEKIGRQAQITPKDMLLVAGQIGRIYWISQVAEEFMRHSQTGQQYLFKGRH